MRGEGPTALLLVRRVSALEAPVVPRREGKADEDRDEQRRVQARGASAGEGDERHGEEAADDGSDDQELGGTHG
jgi:hypothetical protein